MSQNKIGISPTLKRKLSRIEDKELYRDDESFNEENEKLEMHQKQNQQIMDKVRELMYDDDEESALDVSHIDPYEWSSVLKMEILEEMEEENEEDYIKTKEAVVQNQYVSLIPMNDLQLAQILHDKYPLLGVRKNLMIGLKKFSRICQLIVFNRLFETMTLIVIIFNSVMLALDDPTTTTQNSFQSFMDEVFLIYYSIEAGLKIFALGFVLNKGAYLRDAWNIMDLTVIITAYLPYIINSNSVNLNSLRSFRVLRPLRTVSTIKELKTILSALLASLIQMKDHFTVLVFFYTIFAIAGMQMFSGFLKKRCFNYDLGITQQGLLNFCSIDSDCNSGGFICGKQVSNPQGDLVTFDTFGLSIMQVYVVTSLEGWTYIEQVAQLTFNFWVIVYFLLAAIIGAFFLINLTMAIIYINFAELKQVDDLEDTNEFDYWRFRKLGLYNVAREPIPNKFYGHTWDDKDRMVLQMDSLQEMKQRRRTKKITAAEPVIDARKKITFEPIKNANNFSEPIQLSKNNSKIQIQGIFGMAQKSNLNQPIPDLQQLANQRGSLVRKPTFSSNNNSNDDHPRKSKKHDQSQEGQSRNSQVIVDQQLDEVHEQGFRRVSNQQHTLVNHVRKSVEQDSQEIGSKKLLDIPPTKIGHVVQHSYKEQPTRTNMDDQEDLESIKLSELNTIPEDELDNRLEELDALMQVTKQENNQRKTTKKHKQRLHREIYKTPITEEKLDEATIALKTKWFLTKFYPKIIFNPQFLSEEDILISKQHALEEQNKKLQQEKIRELKIQMTYCFKNMKQLIIFKKANTSNSSDRTASRKESSTKFKSSKTTIRKSTTRQVKPSGDDLSASQSRQQSLHQQNTIQVGKIDADPLSANQSLHSPSQPQASARDPDVFQIENNVDTINEQVQDVFKQQRKGKGKKKMEQLTYEQYVEGFNIKDDEIINVDKPSLVERKDIEKNPNMSHKDREIKSSIFYEEYNNTKVADIDENKGILTTIASIEEVKIIREIDYLNANFVTSMNSVLKSMNYTERNYYIYLQGKIGFLKVVQRHILYLTQSSPFTTIMNLAVFINTIILCLDGLVPDSYTATLNQFNVAFTYIFTIEVGLKIIGQGPFTFLKDNMNIFDAIIVVLSLVELFFLGNSSSTATVSASSTTASQAKASTGTKSSFSAFRSVRIFRAFRVLRVTKLMRSLKFMGFLIQVLAASFESFMYIMLLLVLFLFIFTLLGMAFFGGTINFGNQSQVANVYRTSWDTLQESLIVAFDLVTIENWNNLLYQLLAAPVNWTISIIYLISWITLGNWIFLNLLLAILLDHFEEEYTKDDSNLDKDVEIAKDDVLEISNNNTTMFKSTKTVNKSQKLTMSADASENKKKVDPEFVYFPEPGICEVSLWIFSQRNPIRRLCYRIVKDSHFESLIFFMIFLTTCKLIVDTYQATPTTQLTNILYGVDVFFAVFFATEMMLKMIAFGLYQQPHSYLRESWNQLDCFIVSASLVDVSVTSISLGFVKILRLLRTLRPLRFISQNRSMKIMVTALLQSINGIMNVFIMIVLIWLMFSILAVNLIKNTMHHCDMGDQNQYYYTLQRCNERQGVWANRHINYDNVFSSMLSLFVTSSYEGWPDYFFLLVDGDEVHPIYHNHFLFTWFQLTFIAINNFFLLNLLIGVIFVNFHIAEEAARDNTLTTDQTDWIDIQKLIVHSNPNLALYYCPENKIRAYIFNIVTSQTFDFFIMFVVISNVITMACYMDDSTTFYSSVLDNLSLAFTSIFIVESGLKIFALGPVGYIRNSWNQFDFFIVLSSILDILVTYAISNSIGFLKSAPQIIRVFRVLRVTRLFKIVKSFEGLRKLIATLVFALPAVLNVTALLFLVYFIFSILGCYLFNSITSGWAIDSFNNFSDFQHSFQILFRCSTGEDWYKVMFDTMTLGNYYVVYWLIFILLQQNVIINLFVLVILDQYDAFFLNADSPLNKFQEYETQFVEAWAKYATEDKGMKMSDKYLVPLMLTMEAPLGIGLKKKIEQETEEWARFNADKATDENIQKLQTKIQADSKKIVSSNIMKMNIFSDSMGFVTFHSILYAVMKFYIYEEMQKAFDAEVRKKGYKPRDEKLVQEGLKKVAKFEEESTQKIRHRYHGSAIKDASQVNPIVQYLFVLMSFKAMNRYGKKKRALREVQSDRNPNEQFSKGNSSDRSFDGNLEERSSESDQSDDTTPQYQPGQFVGLPNTQVYLKEDRLFSPSSEESNDQVSQVDSKLLCYLVTPQVQLSNNITTRSKAMANKEIPARSSKKLSQVDGSMSARHTKQSVLARK